ncbi:MAG TPA: glutathione S-transferase family protein [Kofleriaceae bacterium]|nr:glutathione S-transferase family protein [Kofleriaceae bacterium]
MKPTLLASSGSQHSRRVTVLIHELGLDIEIQSVDVRPPGMGGHNGSPEFLAINPNGKVPVLREGDFVLWESNAIMWYLAERHGDTPLWPRDPQRKASIAKWQVWQAAHLSPAADGLMFEAFVRPMMKQQTDPAVLESLTRSFHRWCKILDDALATCEYLANDAFTCADIAAASALMYAPMAKMPIEPYANLGAWLARIHARPSWQATEPRR